jgi:hypothetical protein
VEGPAASLNQNLGDEQPHAAALMLTGQDILDSFERLSEVRNPILRDADTGIADHDFQASFWRTRHDADASPLRRELHSIAQEVDQHLLEATATPGQNGQQPSSRQPFA